LKSYSFEDDKLTAHLNDFSSKVLSESEARSAALEDKANKLIVWSVAISAFLLTRLEQPLLIENAGAVLAGALTLCAGFFAFLAGRIKAWDWFSDEIWFPDEDRFRDYRGLSMYHILSVHGVNKSARVNNRKKAALIRRAQRCMLTAIALLAILLAFRPIWRVVVALIHLFVG